MMTFVAKGDGLNEKGVSWQDGYYETRIKTAKQFGYVTNYIQQNPVKKGLVKNPSDWKDSSAAQPELLTDPWPYQYD